MIMFKKKEYTSFLSLVYLIVVALLINFTLVLCGIFVDISNFLTVILFSHGNTVELGSAFNVVLHTVYSETCGAISNTFIRIGLSSFVTILLALIFITLTFGLFVMLIVRMLMI